MSLSVNGGLPRPQLGHVALHGLPMSIYVYPQPISWQWKIMDSTSELAGFPVTVWVKISTLPRLERGGNTWGEFCAPCTPRLILTLLLFRETSQFVAHDCNRHSPKPAVFVEHHLVYIFKLLSGFTIFIMITQSISLDHPCVCVCVCVTCICAELVVVLKSGFRMVKQCSEHLPSDSSRACVGPSTLSKVDCRLVGWC